MAKTQSQKERTMSTVCPYCHQVVPDDKPIHSRLLSLAEEAQEVAFPLPPKYQQFSRLLMWIKKEAIKIADELEGEEGDDG
jgi:hypothetical protein